MWRLAEAEAGFRAALADAAGLPPPLPSAGAPPLHRAVEHDGEADPTLRVMELLAPGASWLAAAEPADHQEHGDLAEPAPAERQLHSLLSPDGHHRHRLMAEASGLSLEEQESFRLLAADLRGLALQSDSPSGGGGRGGGGGGGGQRWSQGVRTRHEPSGPVAAAAPSPAAQRGLQPHCGGCGNKFVDGDSQFCRKCGQSRQTAIDLQRPVAGAAAGEGPATLAELYRMFKPRKVRQADGSAEIVVGAHRHGDPRTQPRRKLPAAVLRGLPTAQKKGLRHCLLGPDIDRMAHGARVVSTRNTPQSKQTVPFNQLF